MSERRDFLSVCNDQGVPLPDFQATFCVRCIQPECSRSKAGGLFDHRVATWHERLFANPPKMPKDDPLYSAITAKKFRDIDVGHVPEVGRESAASTWVDPLVTGENSAAPKPPPRATPRRVSAPSVADPSEETAPIIETAPRKVGAPLNTPFVQGTLLKGAPSAKTADPWAAEHPTAPVGTPGRVVAPGAKIRFRDVKK